MTRQAAEYYGMEIHRNGMVRCPFHPDRTPSMKVDKRFHCFGCGADGDVIDFVSRLFGLDRVDAARKIARDFGVWQVSAGAATPFRQKNDEEKYAETERRCIRSLMEYHCLLMTWKQAYAPLEPGEKWPDEFVEALQKLEDVRYALDVLRGGSIIERASWIAENGKGVLDIERRLSEFTAGVKDGSDISSRHDAGAYDTGSNQKKSD